jgi:hypothetical protein
MNPIVEIYRKTLEQKARRLNGGRPARLILRSIAKIHFEINFIAETVEINTTGTVVFI